MSLLDILATNKKAIHQTELGALLHDIDKLKQEFLVDSDYHSNKNAHRAGKSVKVIKKERWAEMFNSDAVISFSGIVLNAIDCPDNDVTIPTDSYGSLSDAFVFHHHNAADNFPFVSLLTQGGICGADGIDSELDKLERNTPKNCNQSSQFKIDTPFGVFQRDWADVLPRVTAVLTGVFADPSLPTLKNTLRPLLQQALGETRYPCNDVTLWAHSYAVASLSKAILAKILIEFSQGEFSSEKKYLIPMRTRPGGWRTEHARWNKTDFTFMKVSIDRNYLLSRAQKTGDIIGIGTQIQDIQDEIQDYVENSLLIGNETYRDVEKQLFLLPRLDTWDQNGERIFAGLHERFEREIHAKLDEKITTQLVNRDCHDFPFAIEYAPCSDTDDGDTEGQRILSRSGKLFSSPPTCRQSPSALVAVEIGGQAMGRCEVCGIRKIGTSEDQQKEKVCSPCLSRRRKKEQWMSRNIEPHITSELEEIIGPSEENKLVLVSAFFELDSLLNGEIFAQVRWQGKQGQPEITKNASPGRVYRAYETLRGFFEDFQHHEIPSLIPGGKIFPVTLSPVRLEFVCAGKKADMIISRLVCLYEQQFGKFRPVLPLSVGCIFFNRLFPLYVALETGHRLREHLKPRHVEDWEVMASQNEADDPEHYRRLTLKPPALAATAGDKVVYDEWRMPITRSDDKEDALYPHLRLADGQFCHVKKIMVGDWVQVRHGRFDFILLDSAVRRFAISSHGLRHHLGHVRGSYPLSAWDDFTRLWDLVRQLNKNQLGSIESLLVDKMHAWRHNWSPDNQVVRQFCESVVMAPNAFGKKKDTGEYRFLDQDSNQVEPPENCDRNMLIRAAASGMLLDVFDFYFHAQKKDLAINNAITA